MQSRIIKPTGLPLEESSVQFRFTTTDPLGTCVLYVEDFANVNMSGSKGLINFKLGSGTRTYPGAALLSSELFNNFGSPVLNCQGGGTYTVAANDTRKIIVQFNDGSGWQTVPAMEINSVPFALQANSAHNLGGYPASNYLRTASLPTCGGSQALHFDGTTIACVGTGGSYSSLSGASSTNTIDNTNYAQTWNWSSATTQNPITMTANALTTGSLLNLTTSNNTLNSTNGLLNVANTGTSTTGMVARIQSNSTAGSGLTVLANGNVGIGTAGPTTAAHISRSDSTIYYGGNFGSTEPWAVTGPVLTLENTSATDYSGSAVNFQVRNANSVTTKGYVGAKSLGTDYLTTVVLGGQTASNTYHEFAQFNKASMVFGIENTTGNFTLNGGGQPANTLTINSTSDFAKGAIALNPSGGNVGIGTTGPADLLQVFSGNAKYGIIVGNVAVPAVASGPYVRAEGRFYAGDGSAALPSFAFGLAGQEDNGMFRPANDNLGFATSGTEKMRIDSSGNIGVGIATPTEKLDVNGAIKLGMTAGTNAGAIRWDGANFSGYNGNAWVHFVPDPPAGSVCDTTVNYTTAGTYAYTVPASFGSITIRIWGGGGGGGGSCSVSGSSGQNSSIITLGLIAGGGGAGVGPSANSGSAGGAGGVGSGGTINTSGAAAGNGSSGGGISGSGGASPNGGATRLGVTGLSNGLSGNGPGGGGAGSANSAQSCFAGGGGGGAYVEKVYTTATLNPGTYLSDIVVGAGGIGGTGSGTIGGPGAAGKITITCASAGQLPINDRGIVFWNAGAHDSSTTFVYSAAGNVGIGTANPQEKLDVVGNLRVSKNAVQPYACDASHDGVLALTSGYRLCVCNGGSTTWVFTSDGVTACSW